MVIHDAATGNHLEVMLDTSQTNVGQFIAAIPGLGLVAPTSAATVTVQSAHSVVLRYDGTGTLDAKAALDVEFGSDYRPSGTAVPAQVRLLGQVDPDHKTGSIDLWVNNVHYRVEEAASPGGAGPMMAAVVADLSANDFASLYKLTDAQMHMVTEAQYAALGASLGKVSGAHLVGSITYKTSDYGLQAAEVAVTATATPKTGKAHAINGTIELINTQQGWRLYSIKPAS